MDFYNYDDSYSDNKKMKSKLYIILGIVILALTGIIIYFTITSITSTSSKKDENKITQNIKDGIKTLGKTDTNSLLNSISASDKDKKNKSNDEQSEKNNSNDNDPEEDETVLTGSSEEDEKSTQKPTNKPKSTQKPTETNSTSTCAPSSTVEPTTKPPATPTSAPTPKPTVAPTTNPTTKPSQNLGSTDEDDSSGKSFYVNNPANLYCTFTGTPNAYVNGYLKWKGTDGSSVRQYWSTTLNSSGSSVITIKLTPGIHNYTFDIIDMSLNGSTNADIDVSVSLVNRQ
jgi:outer membrane biosynthesis protein TonB